MNNIKVTVDVQLQSGAKVTLTEQQRIKVEKSVEEIVFSETKTTRKKRTKVAFKQWRNHEIETLRSAMANNTGKQSKLFRKVSRDLNRTPAAVAYKAAQIKNGIIPEPTKTNYIPVSSYQTA